MRDITHSSRQHIAWRRAPSRLSGMAAIICFGLTAAMLPASAYSTTKIEAVATVEVVHGFLNKYNVGLSFANANDCNAKIGQLNLVLQNLHAQGVTKGNKSITLSCEEIRSVTVR